MLDVVLPVGISFYTFQTLSYTIDVYRGKMKPEHDFLYFALFVSYFPQLVAGPIERAEELLPRLKAEHRFDYGRAAHGARLMAWGFFKKCVCAAYLGTLADKVYGNAEAYGGGAAAFATAAFAVQIYCDFGGYSDIARGCSELLAVDALDEKADAMEAVGCLRPIVRYPLYAVFLVGMMLLIPKHASAPFIYFQF